MSGATPNTTNTRAMSTRLPPRPPPPPRLGSLNRINPYLTQQLKSFRSTTSSQSADTDNSTKRFKREESHVSRLVIDAKEQQFLVHGKSGGVRRMSGGKLSSASRSKLCDYASQRSLLSSNGSDVENNSSQQRKNSNDCGDVKSEDTETTDSPREYPREESSHLIQLRLRYIICFMFVVVVVCGTTIAIFAMQNLNATPPPNSNAEETNSENSGLIVILSNAPTVSIQHTYNPSSIIPTVTSSFTHSPRSVPLPSTPSIAIPTLPPTAQISYPTNSEAPVAFTMARSRVEPNNPET